MTDLFEPLVLARGPAMKNRLMLAPLTNQQSRPDGTLSDEEFHWLTKRASGGFGLVMTAAAHVQAVGQGFAGQLGVFGDQHLEGLTRLASEIKARGSLAAVQLHHAGNRAPAALVGAAVCPSDDPKTGARGLTQAEVEQLRDDFIAAAKRAEKAGFDGVEVHESRFVKGNVRELKAIWRLKKLDEATTELSLEVFLDPSIPLPTGLHHRRLPLSGFESARRSLRRQRRNPCSADVRDH